MSAKLRVFYVGNDIQARIETMYLDKLDRCITQQFFDKHLATWHREQDGLQRKIQDIQKAKQRRLLQVVSKSPPGKTVRCGSLLSELAR